MIQVLKCDFCTHFTQDVEEMRIHEVNCSFNPKNKKCFTCSHAWDSGYDYLIPECKKHLSILVGMVQGNCSGWENEV